MALVQRLSARLQNHPKRIVFPEGFDQRILQAARQFATRKLGVPILLGGKAHIEEQASKYDVRMDGIRVITPELSDDFEDILKILGGLPKFRDFTKDELFEIAKIPLISQQ